MFKLNAVAFPALIVADDGWVQYVPAESELNEWSNSAVRKYAKQRVVLYDSLNGAWLVASIAPQQRQNVVGAILDALRNRRMRVEVFVRAAPGNPLSSVQEALLTAIDAGDDILTQHVEASELKANVKQAVSFEALVQVLRAAQAI